MADFQFQVALQHVSHLPENQFVNVLYFDVNAPDTVEGVADDIHAVYVDKEFKFANGIDGMTIKVYPDGGGAPVLDKDYSFAGGDGDAPYEVAICLSYYADDIANPNGRRRGRIYVGPLNTAPAASVDATHRDIILDIGEGLASVGSAGNTTWKMRSVANDSYHKIERIGVDDAWDTQRRRGLAPTVREFRDVQ